MQPDDLVTRREFLKLGAAATGAALAWPWLAPSVQAQTPPAPLPTRMLGKTGVQVTSVGLGGEGVLRSWGKDTEGARVIRKALESGITYCDTAPAYNGSQDYYGAVLSEYRDKIFLATKTHDRTRDGSLRLLENSLARLDTDHVDLWQLHNLNEVEELDMIFSKGGAIHAMEEARADGRVRFLGVTGHYDPAVLIEAIRRHPFDTVLVALNVADRARLSFIDQLLPVANERGMGIVGMKVVAKGALLRPDGVATMREALGYVLSLPISTAIIGFQRPDEIEEAVRIARQFQPFPAGEMARLEALAKPFADDASRFKRPA